ALGGAYRAARLVGSVVVAVTDASVRSFTVGASVAAVDQVALPAPAAFVHATPTVLAITSWGDGLSTPVMLVDVSDAAGDLALRGSVSVPGWVGDEQKLDVYGGVLRIVTHDGNDGALSRCLTYSLANLDAPALLGSLDLVRGEQLFATRFDGDRAYVVTFEQVDPLWVLDLSNPAAPKVAGQLVVPGWSTHLVPTGDGRLVAVGVDPADGWHTIVSLFSVADPAAPALLDREDFGWGWSTAFHDVKALGVFPADGLVTVPLSGESERLAVLALGPAALSLRGDVALDGPALRGFPHARGLVAVSNEEVAVVDPLTLADRGRVTIAEHVVDVVPRAGGDLPLVAKRRSGRLGDVVLPLVPERAFPFGDRVAVVGWDDLGRAAVVVDLAPATPTVSARFALGNAWFSVCDPSWGMARADGIGVPWGGGTTDAVLTDDGHLVVHGLPGGSPTPVPMPGGGGKVMPMGTTASGVTDGFVVLDVVAGALDAPIEVVDGYVTGFVADDGGDLVVTVGGGASSDRLGRPRMRHDLVRVHLATRATTTAVNVPGWVVSAAGDLVFTVEETWDDGWTWDRTVVATAVVDTVATVVARRALPADAYDVRASGATLVYTVSSGGNVGPLPPVAEGDVAWGSAGGLPWMPTTAIGSVRLGATLAAGPTLPASDAFRAVALVEDGAVLVVEDGTRLVRFDLAGATATPTLTVALVGWPLAIRRGAVAGTYVVALGYAGTATVP
ncbi:MAG: beta-propeller domain-containing protein, partial [Planctomycetia bacterium]|nr:beta-propeller domain-containing protein [Planctomycetia bacterium]